MTPRVRTLTALLLGSLVAACSAPEPPAAAPEAQISAETAPAPAADTDRTSSNTAPVPPATPGLVTYACDDGSGLSVTYAEYSALVKLPKESIALPRAESASKEAGDAYIGEELSLYRDGNRVQLQGSGTPRTCTESPAGR